MSQKPNFKMHDWAKAMFDYANQAVELNAFDMATADGCELSVANAHKLVHHLSAKYEMETGRSIDPLYYAFPNDEFTGVSIGFGCTNDCSKATIFFYDERM